MGTYVHIPVCIQLVSCAYSSHENSSIACSWLFQRSVEYTHIHATPSYVRTYNRDIEKEEISTKVRSQINSAAPSQIKWINIMAKRS